MSAPAWFDTLARAYLAGEASLFAIVAQDRAAVCADLVARLSATREIVGVLSRTGGLRFPNLGDQSRFEQLWQARRVLSVPPLRADDPLARIWAVLEVRDVGQGWVLADGEHLAGPRSASAAPPLATWATAPRLREANHLVIVVCGEAGKLDPAFLAAAPVIERLGAAPPPPPLALVAPAAPTEEALAERLSTALVERLPGWPAAAWPSRAPFLAAFAEVLAEFGAIAAVEVRFDPEAGLQLEGPGAEALRTAWSRDPALDAAIGKIAREWEVPEARFAPGGVPAIDPTGLRVLARRAIRGFF